MSRSTRWWLLAAAAAVVALRVAGLNWGLPALYNSDEPHFVGLAVSFGGGSLRPVYFKYPTLWPYLLFFVYGLYFAAWSGLGLLHTAADFAGLFAWHAANFYLIGRVLSALIGLAAVLALAKAEGQLRPRGAPWAALLLAFCPMLNEVSHAARPDCLMVFFVCCAWLFILRIYRDGGRRWHWLGGLCLGLAMSSQYTAVFVCAAAALAHLLCPARPPRRRLFEGMLAVGVGFLGGSPFIALDFPNFWASMRDLFDLAALEPWSRLDNFRRLLGNAWSFAGVWSLAGPALIIGAVRLLSRDRGLAWIYIGTAALYAAALGSNPDGSGSRYLLGAFPGLALLAAEGLDWLGQAAPGPWPRTAVVAAALVPGLAAGAAFDRQALLPDTRRQATRWIEAHVPPGSAVLLDLPHAGPDLPMTKAQALELFARTSAAGSARSRFYRALADYHPGGGWRIYRVKRSARDMRSSPRHVGLAQADAATLDVEGGLAGALAAGVEFVVISDYGATPERAPQLAGFFSELERRGQAAASFAPEPGRSVGPRLTIYRLGKKQPGI
ncbi:MAG: glycosyltransferase family 39 protein [Elusimicrobia bacterium]|nr:glycosyltransferase family 39 protein [Elusimicrobiota bacterium]